MLTPEFDYSRLDGRIRERFKTQGNFAKAVGMSRTSLNLKLRNHVDFTGPQILRTCDVLDIPRKEISAYFFTEKVQNGELFGHT